MMPTRPFLWMMLFVILLSSRSNAQNVDEFCWTDTENERSFLNCTDRDHIYSLYSIISHTQGKGIGYRRGYTSLEFFLMSSDLEQYFLYPFIDLRGHGLNNQKLAANAGVGVRYLSNCAWLLGANLYYDYRQGDHQGFDQLGYGFQQIAIGFEALGPCYDLRLNIYQPICRKTFHYSQTYFKDDLGIIPTLVNKKQSTMKGFDAEIGGCVAEGKFCGCCWDWGAYLAAGPYYLYQKDRTGRWGGKARLETFLGRYFFLEVRAAYDHADKGTVQVRLGVDLPLYPFTSVKPYGCQDPDDYAICYTQWKDWVAQPTSRADIMPLQSRHRR